MNIYIRVNTLVCVKVNEKLWKNYYITLNKHEWRQLNNYMISINFTEPD